jgi:hypothetical protein
MDPNNRAKGGPLPDPDRLPDDMDMDEEDTGEGSTARNACPEPEDAGSIQRPPADS